MADYFTIKYSINPKAKKTDYLKNPKGYGIRNFFSQKMLIGTLKPGEDLSVPADKYNSLNSVFFPMKSIYVSDEFGMPKNRRTDNPSIIPASYSTDKTKKDGSSGIVIAGLLAVGAFIYFSKGKKRR